MKKFKVFIALFISILMIATGVIYSLSGIILTNQTYKKQDSIQETKELNSYLKDARSRLMEVNSIETTEFINKKDETTFVLNYTNYNINGSHFKFMVETKENIETFDDIKIENVEKMSEVYNTVEKNEDGELEEGIYSFYQTKDGEGNKGPFFKKQSKEKINIREMQKLTNESQLNGIFDFLYNLKEIVFEEEVTEDTIILKGELSDISTTIILNKETMLPMKEIYYNENLTIERIYKTFNKESFSHEDFSKKTNQDKITFISNILEKKINKKD